MTSDWRMRLTEIGGETRPDDWTIIDDQDRDIGRIFWSHDRWIWTVALPLPGAPNGETRELDEAKTAFRTAWDRFVAEIGPAGLAIGFATKAAAHARFRPR